MDMRNEKYFYDIVKRLLLFKGVFTFQLKYCNMEDIIAHQ